MRQPGSQVRLVLVVAAAIKTDVVCLDGQGMTSVDGEAAPLPTGERILMR